MTEEFGVETTVEVRFQDLDLAGHVNNAVYATYAEQARIDYLRTVLDDPPIDQGVVLAGLELDFRGRVTLETDELTVGSRTESLGRSSIRIVHEIRNGDEVVATAEGTLVTVDDEGDPRPIPDRWREPIAEFEGIDPGGE